MNTPVSGGAVSDAQIDAVAKVIAECMDYPWAHMPERGRNNMREHAAKVMDALVLTHPAVPVLASDAIKAAFEEGCMAISTYNDMPNETVEEVWEISQAKRDQASILAAPQPAPTPSACTCVYATAANTESVRKGYEMGGYVKEECAACKAIDAAPLASEPEPVVAEQARDFAAWWDTVGSQTYKAAAKEPACTAWMAALASQSTPPPESAGQGLSDAEIVALADSYHLTGELSRNRAIAFARAILAANRTAQPDAGRK